MAMETMQELFVDQLRDLYDAEKQLTRALPKLAKAASNEELAQGFRDHLEQTKTHVTRIEQTLEMLGQKARSKPCEAMKGLIQEGQEAIAEDLEEEDVHDLALVAAARRVEHYEMAAYETLVMAAQAMKQPEIVQLLQQTLREEMDTDKRLVASGKTLLKTAVKGGREQASDGNSGGSRRSSAPAKNSGGSSGSNTSGGNSGRSGGSSGSGSSRGASSSASSRSSAGKGKKSTAASHERGGSRSSTRGGSDEGHLSKTTTDHEEIQSWAEERGGKPACVRGTGGKGDIGLLRIEFPGKPQANDAKLEEIGWDEFFDKFDERKLALVYQEHTAGGQKSNFNKLISREESGTKMQSRTAR